VAVPVIELPPGTKGDMATAERIRVLIAGTIVDTKHTLVRRVLEDSGYEVVGEVRTADAVFESIRAAQPDAVVLDEDLTTHGATVAAIRKVAPDSCIVVFSAPKPEAAPDLEADAYLDKGVPLAVLTATLGRLLAEQTILLTDAPPTSAYAAASRGERSGW
jgi:DNA-binding NarL/FixJ family response regulator